jgi:hypothetical protein
MFEKGSNKSKFYSQRNEEHIRFVECLLLLSSEFFIFRLMSECLKI